MNENRDAARAGPDVIPTAVAVEPLRPRSTISDLVHSEAAGGIVLMTAAAAALAVANGPFATTYFAALSLHVGPLSVLHWIDDALMSLFFLLVGLEIKRELVDGHLTTWSDRALPGFAAVSGMAVPAVIYLTIAGGTPGLARGWAIPSATDIAFAIGVMALLGPRVPVSLKLFRTTVAIIDDMGAVAVLAIAYTTQIGLAALLAAALVAGAMFALNRAGVTRLWPYLGLASALWVAVWMSGIHATLPGSSQPRWFQSVEHVPAPVRTARRSTTWKPRSSRGSRSWSCQSSGSPMPA